MFHVELAPEHRLHVEVPCPTVVHMESSSVLAVPGLPRRPVVNGWPALTLLSLLASWRVLLGWMTVRGTTADLPSWLPGFTPLAALAVGGGFLLPRRLGLIAPVGALLASDLALTAIYQQGLGAGMTLTRYGSLLALSLMGAALREAHPQRFGKLVLVAGSLVGSGLFYVATNTVAWLGAAETYPRSLAGWVQALTVGTPGFPPSWVFFRNSLVSDLLVSMLLAATSLPRMVPRRARAGQTTLRPASAA